MPAPPQCTKPLRIYCLGAFRATLDGTPIAFDTDKARALLAYLAVESGGSASLPHQRQRLAGLLWSDQPEEKALHSLRQTLSSLRKTLGDEALPEGKPFLLVQRDSLQLNPKCDAWLDVRQFQECLARPENQKLNFLNVRRVQQAAALYRGPFLDQLYLSGSPLFEEWATVLREACNQQAMAALEILANYHERRDETGLARQAAQRLVELAPWDENVHTRLMHLYAQEGLWSAAQNQYHNLRRYLSREMGLEIAPETKRLFEQIRRAAQRCSLPSQNQSLARRFPPAAHNLPAALTPFVGREAELDQLSDLLADPGCRLLVLVGPGGMGKTRLALQAAAAQVGLFADGVFFVPLDALASNIPTLQHSYLPIATAIAAALGFQFYNAQDLPGQLLDYLRSKDLLLILDNFETVALEGSNEGTNQHELLADILHRAPAVKLLVTSRVALNLHSEHTLELSGLSYPPAGAVGANAVRADAIRPYDAIDLFAQIAQRANPNLIGLDTIRPANIPSSQSDIPHPKFEIQNPTWDAVARICQMLEGTPLGIELAAAWTRRKTPAEIAHQIEIDLDFLATRMPDLPPRHRSLRAVFLGSWALLTEAEQAALSGLSIFRGGFSEQAAADVAGASPEILRTLLDKSLLRRSHTEIQISEILQNFGNLVERLDLHRLVGQFAAEQLASQPLRQAALAGQHARFYNGFMAGLSADLRSQRQPQALADMALEAANLRQAWLHLAATAQSAEMANALASCVDPLYNFYNIKSWFLEGVELFTAAATALRAALPASAPKVATTSDVSSSSIYCIPYTLYHSTLGMILPRLAAFHIRLGQLDLAWEELQEAEVGLELQPPVERAMQRSILCGWLLRRGKHEPALHAAEEVLAAYQQAGFENGIARAQMYLGTCHQYMGHMQEALQHLQTSLDLCRKSGEPRLLLLILDRLAGLYSHFGDFPQAQACYTEALQISRDLGDLYFQAMVANNLGAMHQELARHDQALACYLESLQLCQKIGDRAGEALAICNLGEVAMLQGDYEQAIQYAGQALAMGREMEDSLTELSGLCVIAETAVQQGQAAKAREVALEGLRLASSSQNIEMLVRLAVALGGALKVYGQVEQARQLLTAANQHEACDEYHRQRVQAWLDELGGAAAGEAPGLEELVVTLLTVIFPLDKFQS